MINTIVASPNIAHAKAAHSRKGTIGIALYNSGSPDLPGLGRNLEEQFRKALPGPASNEAWDFLSISLAIFAADRFVMRRDADDGWTRVIQVDIAVSNPALWQKQSKELAAALRFLTGDIWNLRFSPGGKVAPRFSAVPHSYDAACLFSGGLDSLLGALQLQASGRRPLLISQGSPKEILPQTHLAQQIGLVSSRLEARVSERWRQPYEASTRGRSLIFFAYGVIAASALGLSEVIVPENGFIAVNPPLTNRRLGSLSTRTTHYHFLRSLNQILGATGIGVTLTNPFEGKSKGEMLRECAHPKKKALAASSYSCGKGKRKNMQCGRCVPCLIRRASFQAAGIPDGTRYQHSDLSRSTRNDDVLATRLATSRTQKMKAKEFSKWVERSGPLPDDIARKQKVVRAVSTGMEELRNFLDGIVWR